VETPARPVCVAAHPPKKEIATVSRISDVNLRNIDRSSPLLLLEAGNVGG
jgi:hypothetical protein